jgi:hypothetical protein
LNITIVDDKLKRIEHYLLRDLLDVTDFDLDAINFELDEAADDDLRGDLCGLEPDGSSTIALRIHVTGGNPSNILCHVLPSSLEPNSLPLRVPK